MPMLRLLAIRARMDPLDHAGGNAPAWFGQTKGADFLEHVLDHVLSTLFLDQAQRKATILHQTDRVGKTDAARSQPLWLGRPQHQPAQQGMGQQQRVEFLDDPIGSLRTQGAGREPQMRIDFIKDQFHLPTLVREHHKLFGRIDKRVQQRGDQPIDLRARSGNAWVGKTIADHPHQHAFSPTRAMILADEGQVGSIAEPRVRLEQHMAYHSSQHMASPIAQRKDRLMTMKATVPQDQSGLPLPAFQQQTGARRFGLPTGTDLGITDQMGRTFDHQHQPGLGKGAVSLLVIAAVAEALSMARGIGYRLHRAIESQQTHPAPEGSWRLFVGVWTSTLHKEFLHDFAAQLLSAIAEGRFDWESLRHVIAHGAQSTHQSGIDRSLGEMRIQMQAQHPVDHRRHIELAFALFPHLIGLQQFFNLSDGQDFLQQSQREMLTHLAFLQRFGYRSDHEAAPFLDEMSDGLSMPPGLPHGLRSPPFVPFLLILWMSYSYLNRIGASPIPTEEEGDLNSHKNGVQHLLHSNASKRDYLHKTISRGNPSACGCDSGGAACAAPSPRSGGCARG